MFTLPATTTPGGLMFADNPLWVDYTDIIDDDPPISGFPFIIKQAGKQIFEGRFNTPMHLNIAPVIRAAVSPLPVPADGDYHIGPFYIAEDEDQMQDRLFEADFNGGLISRAVYALPGGASKHLTNQSAAGANIFTNRFLASGNRFMTVRSADLLLAVRESELSPLYFINDADSLTVTIEAEGAARPMVGSGLDKGIWTLNPVAMRRLFADRDKRIYSVFRITFGEGRSCCLVIEETPAAPNLCSLKFRNSLGVFELLDLYGPDSTQWEQDSESDSDGAISRYVSKYDDFERTTIRKQLRRCWQFATGQIADDRLRLVLDAVSSEETYLAGIDPVPVRVTVEVEEAELAERTRQPQQLTLTLRESLSESHLMPVTEWADQSQGFRTFDACFNDVFG